jgi:hypothetical protein
LTRIPCFLNSVLAVKERCKKAVRNNEKAKEKRSACLSTLRNHSPIRRKYVDERCGTNMSEQNTWLLLPLSSFHIYFITLQHKQNWNVKFVKGNTQSDTFSISNTVTTTSAHLLTSRSAILLVEVPLYSLRAGKLAFEKKWLTQSLVRALRWDSMFLWNVGIYLQVHTSLLPKKTCTDIFSAMII